MVLNVYGFIFVAMEKAVILTEDEYACIEDKLADFELLKNGVLGDTTRSEFVVALREELEAEYIKKLNDFNAELVSLYTSHRNSDQATISKFANRIRELTGKSAYD